MSFISKRAICFDCHGAESAATDTLNWYPSQRRSRAVRGAKPGCDVHDSPSKKKRSIKSNALFAFLLVRRSSRSLIYTRRSISSHVCYFSTVCAARRKTYKNRKHIKGGRIKLSEKKRNERNERKKNRFHTVITGCRAEPFLCFFYSPIWRAQTTHNTHIESVTGVSMVVSHLSQQPAARCRFIHF